MADSTIKTTKKRGRATREKKIDETNGSNDAPIDLMSPPPTKKRATTAKQLSNTSKTCDTSDPLSRIPKAFMSEESHRCFTKLWWKEVTAKDEFWEQFEANIPVSVWKKRLTVHVVTEAKPAGTEVSRTSGGTELNYNASATSDVLNGEGMFRCETCGKHFEAHAGTNWDVLGTIECEMCLMDGMGNNDQHGSDKPAVAKSRKVNDAQAERKAAKPRARGPRKSKAKENSKSTEKEQLEQAEAKDELAETAQAALNIEAAKDSDGTDHQLANGDKHIADDAHLKRCSVVPEPVQKKTQELKSHDKQTAIDVEESLNAPSKSSDFVKFNLPKDAKDMSSAASSIEMLSGNLDTEKTALVHNQVVDCEDTQGGQELTLVDETKATANDEKIKDFEKSTNDLHPPELDNGTDIKALEESTML